MKILHIITGLDTGGAEIVLSRLAQSSGEDASLQHAVVSLTAIGNVGERLQAAGIQVMALGMSGLADAPRVFFALVRLIKTFKPDIVQTWMYHADLLGGLAAKCAGVKHVIWGVRNTHLYAGGGVSRPTYFVMRACALLSHFVPSVIVCVAEAAQKTHAQFGYDAKKMRVIANGYDPQPFPSTQEKNEMRRALDIAENTMVIGSVGRFNEYKDHQNFIAAAAILAPSNPQLRFLLVGRDVDHNNAQLMGWIQSSGYANRFILLGERPDVPRCLAAMDIFCLHSKSEGFPNALGEAMAAGLPCVTTDVGDAALLIADTGLVVPAQSPIALAQALALLVNEPKEMRNARGQNAKRHIEEYYSTSAMLRRYESLYHELDANIDIATVAGFGDEWQRFDQSELSKQEHARLFEEYFSIFPWHVLPRNAVGFDLGCGSGRWAKLVAPRVGHLHCIDPSAALEVARKNLAENANCEFHAANVDTMPLADVSMDFGYSLGVLHHVPDTQAALSACVRKLKPGAPFLLYLYYAFDSRPWWFRAVWQASEALRYAISRLPHRARYAASQIIAAVVYFPLAKLSYVLEKCGMDVSHLPLSAYRDRSFYTMRTDALDRFGTRLEQRFTCAQMQVMMERAGLERIVFSHSVPFWCAVGYRVAQAGR